MRYETVGQAEFNKFYLAVHCSVVHQSENFLRENYS